MKKRLLVLSLILGFAVSSVLSQKLVSEKQIELTKNQKKYEMDFALPSGTAGNFTVFFEPQRAPKVKGERMKFQRYEMVLDKDMNVVSEEFKTLGTGSSVKPKIYFDNFRIAYTTWVDNETEDKINKMMFQLIKYDNNNLIMEIKDYELCDEKGFGTYKVTNYNGELFVLAQYEKKKTKDKNEKNRDYLVYKRIDPNTMELKAESELNLLGKDELGLEAVSIIKDKIYLVGPQLLQMKIGNWKIPKGYYIFKLNLNGEEETRGEITIPVKAMGVGSVYLAEGNGMLYMAGEYGDPKKIYRAPSVPYSGSSSVKVANPFIGMFIKKYDFDLQEKGTATFSYKEKILAKLKKGNKGFTKKGGNYNLQDFYFLSDGSFYITAEMFVKYYRSVCTDNGYVSFCSYYTDFDYMDALIFKFTPNGELDWLVQVDRDNYKKTYYGYIKTNKPLDPGKLETYLVNDEKMVCLYNTPGRKYSGKRFGLSEVVITKDGQMTDPYDFTSEQQFGLLDGGLINIGNNEMMAVGTDKKGNNLWVKKIKIID
jgi:hypothetical protein